MVTFYREDEPGFRRHYGRRNGVEGMFSSLKGKYLRFISAKHHPAGRRDYDKGCLSQPVHARKGVFPVRLAGGFQE